MTSPRTPGIRVLEEALPFQRGEWAFERAGWIALTVFLLAAFTGLLGPGGLWRQRLEHGRLAVEYDRIGRRAADLPLDITWIPAAPGSGLDLALSEGCLDGTDLESVQPEPSSASAGERGGLGFSFRREASAREIRLRITLRPRRPGSHPCRVAAGGGDSVAFRQWILP